MRHVAAVGASMMEKDKGVKVLKAASLTEGKKLE